MNIGAVAEFQNVSQPPEKLHLHRGPIAFHSQIETAFGMRPWRSDRVFQRSPQADEARENSEYGVWNHSPARASKGKDRFAVAKNYARTHIMQGTLARSGRIRVSRPGTEPRHAVAENKAKSFHRHTGAKSVPMSQRQRDHVPFAIRGVQMNRSGLLLRFGFQGQRFMVLDRRFDFCRRVE